jgi:hypothetical protein
VTTAARTSEPYTASTLRPGVWYVDSDGAECVAVEYQEYSTQQQGERDVLVVYPGVGRAWPPHLLPSHLLFRERGPVVTIRERP